MDLTSLLAPQQSDPTKRYDLATQMLSGGMSNVGASGSPLLAFMAPLAGGLIQNKINTKQTAAEDAAKASATEDLLGVLGGNPQANKYLDILNNPLVPDHLKSAANSMLTRMMTPSAKPSRKIRTDVNGVDRYVDTGEAVFPDVKTDAKGEFAPGDLRQYNLAAEALQKEVKDLISDPINGIDTEEQAMEVLRASPLYAPQFDMMDRYQALTTSNGNESDPLGLLD